MLLEFDPFSGRSKPFTKSHSISSKVPLILRTTVHTGIQLLPRCIYSPICNIFLACTRSNRPTMLGSKRLDRIECRICVGGCPCESDPDWACDCSKCLHRQSRLGIARNYTQTRQGDLRLGWQSCRRCLRRDRKSRSPVSPCFGAIGGMRGFSLRGNKRKVFSMFEIVSWRLWKWKMLRQREKVVVHGLQLYSYSMLTAFQMHLSGRLASKTNYSIVSHTSAKAFTESWSTDSTLPTKNATNVTDRSRATDWFFILVILVIHTLPHDDAYRGVVIRLLFTIGSSVSSRNGMKRILKIAYDKRAHRCYGGRKKHF